MNSVRILSDKQLMGQYESELRDFLAMESRTAATALLGTIVIFAAVFGISSAAHRTNHSLLIALTLLLVVGLHVWAQLKMYREAVRCPSCRTRLKRIMSRVKSVIEYSACWE